MSDAIVSFFCQGKPVSQPRGKAVRQGGFVRVVSNPTDHPITNWKESLRADALKGMARFGGRLFELEGVGLRVELIFQFQRPKAFTKPKWRDSFLLVTTGKDVDNLAKSVLDVCNGIVWDDDRRVSTLIVRKQYVMPDQAPGVHVGVFVDAHERVPFWP